MGKKIIWLVLSCAMVAAMISASCATSTKSTQTSTSTTTSMPTTSTMTTTARVTTTPTTTSQAGNWWDSLGKPQYGGDMVLRMNSDPTSWDPYNTLGTVGIDDMWEEKLFADDWTLNPTVFDYKINWRPSDYEKGQLAESWEFTDPTTFVAHLRQGIHWQNLPPVNGREFIADDIVFHYDRLFGLGDGFTKASPGWAANASWQQLISVTATDKYTVAFKWKTASTELILESMFAIAGHTIEAPEAVRQWGNLEDWHHAMGTGAFILTDYVSGSSAKLIKNTNYWAYDERYPQNKLPYANTITWLIIPDDSTTTAALRTGKLDVQNGISLQKAQQILKTNPEILQITTPATVAVSVVPRNDVKPFDDIRVREAMQMAIDLPTIFKTYYGGVGSPNPQTLTSEYVTGWGFPYEQWPQDLKDQYAYNPTAAKKLLADAGYPTGFKTDIVVASSGDIDLLQIVKSYFAQVGIDMEIRTMDPASWTSYVRAGHKHDQMAEMSGADPLGLTFEPLIQIQRYRTGYASNWVLVSDPVFDAFYPKALAATSVDGIKQVVKDANEYVARHHFAISLLQPTQYALCQPWIKGYNGQSFSITGELGRPVYSSFYAARFWIDQNLKKSMGH